MKVKLTLLVVILSFQLVISQNYQTIEEINDACAQLGFSGDEDAEIAVDAILDKMGLYRNFVIQECPDINNAVAKNIDIGSGKKERYILYDNDFFNKIDVKAGNDWAATSILAHEIGHHLNGHALNDEGSNLKWEIEADEFSGFVLARMGATLEDAQSAIQTFKYEKATRTHPAKADRLLAIEKGYNRGLGKTIVVEKIDDEIIKDITINKKEEIINNESEDVYIAVDGISAEQVLYNYINAIGGEENVRNIKTLKQSNQSYLFNVLDGEKKDRSTSTGVSTYLTPNNCLYEGESDGEIRKSLTLDGKRYNDWDNDGKWELGSVKQGLSDNSTSYINEYSLLLTNAELVFLGMKSMEGISCYAIELPKIEVVSKNPETWAWTESKEETWVINYYNIDTGLLAFSEKTSRRSRTNESKNKSESDEKATTIYSYLDYRPVKGVLFPFREERKGKVVNPKYPYGGRSEYTDIQVNPIINKEDFKVSE